MHNHSRISNRTPLFIAPQLAVEFLVLLRRHSGRSIIRKLLDKGREAALYGLTTLAVSSLFLGGVYLFLVQLAKHGW